MSSLNKVSIFGSNAGSSRQPSQRSGIRVNNINSLQASARSRAQLGSRRMSRSSQRNVDMILKRVLHRKRTINKAISDLLTVYPKEIGYDSLQNIVQKFKLPLKAKSIRQTVQKRSAAYGPLARHIYQLSPPIL